MNSLDHLTKGPLSRSYAPDPFVNRKYLCPKCGTRDAVRMISNLVTLMQIRRRDAMVTCGLCDGPAFTREDATSQRKVLMCTKCDIIACASCQRTKLDFVK